VNVRALFRSEEAQKMFRTGIRQGFNFGLFKVNSIRRNLMAAEERTSSDVPGIFLAASARKSEKLPTF